MSNLGAHHICISEAELVGNDGRGRTLLLPGSSARARLIASHMTDVVEHTNPRGHAILLGKLTRDGRTIDAGVVSTGMGCPSLGIIVSELIDLGARRLLRVGTSGSLQHGRVNIGDVVIATGAVRDEGTSDAFCPRDVPAVAHPHWVRALSQAAVDMGLASRTFAGLLHSKDALYGREFPVGPLKEANADYMRMLERIGVLASEMEASHLFILANTYGPDLHSLATSGPSTDVVKAGSVVAVIGTSDTWASPAQAAEAEARAIEIALRGAVQLNADETGG